MLLRKAMSILSMAFAITAIVVWFGHPASANSYKDTVTYIGTEGDYEGQCNVPGWNNNNGCQFWNDHAYDLWYASYECSGGLYQGGPCNETFHICHTVQNWSGSGCSGTLLWSDRTYKAVCQW